MSEEQAQYNPPAGDVNNDNRGALFNTQKAGWEGDITIECEKMNAYIVAIRPFGDNPNPRAPTHKLFIHSREKGVSHATAVPLFSPRHPEKAATTGKIAEGSSDTHWVHVYLSDSTRGTKFVSIKLHAKEDRPPAAPPDGESDSGNAEREDLPF